jgi:hypothetical protein
MTGLSVILGFGAYTLINKRLHLGGIFQLFSPSPEPARAQPMARVHS